MAKDIFNDLARNTALANKARILYTQVPVSQFIAAGIGAPQTPGDAIKYADIIGGKTTELIQQNEKRERMLRNPVGH